MAALQTLMEMGFSENAVKKALSVTGGGVEQAMEWLLAHSEDPGVNDPPAQKRPEGAVGTATGGAAGGTDDAVAAGATDNAAVGARGAADGAAAATGGTDNAASGADGVAAAEGGTDNAAGGADGAAAASEGSGEGPEEAKSIKCDDCGKLFKTSEEVEFHAVKSGHTNFSESTEEKRPLTEEEKLEKKRNLEEKIKLRRKEREEREAKEALDREKKRIQMGQEIAERKRIMQEQEMKKIAEERKREKLEDKLARQRVKEQIERDRQARKEKQAGVQSGPAQQTKPQPTTSQHAPKKDYTQARLQIRLPSGTPMVQEFNAKEPLSAVRLWVSLNRQDGASPDAPFNLSTTFPRKIFSDEDMDKPLDALGLVPSAVLIVSK